MLIEEKVHAVLSAASGVTGLVPVSRIKVPGNWQNLARPYIIHFPVSANPLYTHQGLAALTVWPFYQVSCFADSYSEARKVAESVIDALNGTQGDATFFWIGQSSIQEAPKEFDPQIHHVAVDFRVAEAV